MIGVAKRTTAKGEEVDFDFLSLGFKQGNNKPANPCDSRVY